MIEMLDYRLRSKVESDDVEALQTDIMRFMAILGFCLMVIFAMVQSLPNVVVEHEPELISQDILLEQVKDLEAKAKTLERELLEAEQILQDKKQEIQTIINTVMQSQYELERVKVSVEKEEISLSIARNQIRHQRRVLDKLETQSANLEKIKKDVIERMRNSTINTDDSIQSVTTQEPVNVADEKIDQIEETKPVDRSQSQKKGLSLRFASAEDLQALITQSRVSFYVNKGKQYFRISSSGKVTLESLNGQFYQMAGYTVPYSLKSIAKRKLTLTDSAAFGVTLVPQIAEQLSQYVNNYQQGELIINRFGKVIYSE